MCVMGWDGLCMLRYLTGYTDQEVEQGGGVDEGQDAATGCRAAGESGGRGHMGSWGSKEVESMGAKMQRQDAELQVRVGGGPHG